MTATDDDLRTIAVQFWNWWINKPNASDKESVDSLTALLAAAEQRGAERVSREWQAAVLDRIRALSTAGKKP